MLHCAAVIVAAASVGTTPPAWWLLEWQSRVARWRGSCQCSLSQVQWLWSPSESSPGDSRARIDASACMAVYPFVSARRALASRLAQSI